MSTSPGRFTRNILLGLAISGLVAPAARLVGTAGLGWNVSSHTLIHAGVGYDNTPALQWPSGFVIRWGRSPATPEPPR